MTNSKTVRFLIWLVFYFILFLVIAYYINLIDFDSEKTLQKYSGVSQITNPTSFNTNQKSDVTLVFTGDIMLGRSVMLEALAKKDRLYPFRKVYQKLKEADITFINLENPIVENCPKHEGGYKFCTTFDMAEGLVFSGVDVVTLANNHSANYGQEGLKETVDFLESRGILVTGIGKLTIKEVDGTRFGFLGFDKSQQEHPTLQEDELSLIKDSDKLIDVLIVGMHWGSEYQNKALPGVRELAGELIKNGVDVVVGHHPHWVQDVECFEKVTGFNLIQPDGLIRFTPVGNKCPPGSKPVYYSLGNFIFDQMWGEETKKGIVVEMTFQNGEYTSVKEYETYISSIGQPEFAQE